MASLCSMYLLLLSMPFTAFAHNASTTSSTTLQPVFAFPFDGTSTIYQSTATISSSVDCDGSALVVSTFSAVIATNPPTNTATVTSPVTTSSIFACAPSTSSETPTYTSSIPTSTPTAVPPPPVSPEAQILISEIRTAILYASLIANGGNQAKLCSAINPASLSNGTGINGTAVQQEVCASASIEAYLPSLFAFLVASNGKGLSYLTVALFAVQAVAGFGGVSLGNTAALCGEIEEQLINNLFVNYVEGTGTAIKRFVCSGGS